jgi:hypothetical protein
MIVETGGDEKAPIILGRPFLSTTKAIIYADSAKIFFTINGRKERFNFKKCTLNIRVHPQTSYLYEDTTAAPTKKKRSPRRVNHRKRLLSPRKYGKEKKHQHHHQVLQHLMSNHPTPQLSLKKPLKTEPGVRSGSTDLNL